MLFSLPLEWNKNNNNDFKKRNRYKWIDESADFYKYREQSSPATAGGRVRGHGGVAC